ncbi:hypothetical protein HLI_04025 [Halobacillus litoralis]|uniref:Uncharacterized protein n=1 Tax=Halobacillus litoralis TaxID=45668 RepID=A0A410M9U9_9BACI|nr:hypothetical protein HLI_04025 [Halobacillus litoralis]
MPPTLIGSLCLSLAATIRMGCRYGSRNRILVLLFPAISRCVIWWLLSGETLNANFLIGFTFIMFGIIVVTIRRPRKTIHKWHVENAEK